MGSLLDRINQAKAGAGLLSPVGAAVMSSSPVVPSSLVETAIGGTHQLPKFLGGGEYYTNPSLQGPKSYGSLPERSGYQRDHNIPYSLGGTSNSQNLRYVPNSEAKARDAFEQEMARQVNAGKISRYDAIARVNAFYIEPNPLVSGLQGIASLFNIKDRIASIKNYFTPSPDQVRVRDVLREMADTVYTHVANTLLPGSTQGELHNPQFLGDVAKEIPGATVQVGGEILTHPIRTALTAAAGTVRGLSKTVTDIIINNAFPKADRNATRIEVSNLLSKYIGFDEPTAFGQGFEMAGRAAPLILATGVAGEVPGAAGVLARGAAFTGVGQVTLDREATLHERADKLVNDLVSFGLLEAGSQAFSFVKRKAMEAQVQYWKTQQLMKDEGITPEAVGQPLEGPGALNSPRGPRESVPSGFEQTVAQSPNTLPEVAQAMTDTYEPLSNQRTLEQASNLIATDPEGAQQLAYAEDRTALANTTGILLIDKAQREGNFQDAIDLAKFMAQKATEQGQAIQSLAIYNHLTPEGVLVYAQNVIDSANKLRPDLDASISPEDAQKIYSMADAAQQLPEGSRERTVQTALVLKEISELVPPKVAANFASVQMFSRLFSLKGGIRKLLGDLALGTSENVNQAVVGVPLDKLTSLFTGERTTTLPDLGVQFRGAQRGFTEGAQDVSLGIDTMGGIENLDIPISKSKNLAMQTMDKMIGYEYRVTARAAFEAAYDESVRNQLEAASLSGNEPPPPDVLDEVATQDGLYRSFQNKTLASQAFKGIKRALNLNQDFGLGSQRLPIPKIPANQISAAIDYSPVGIIRGIIDVAKPLITGSDFNQRQFVLDTSRGITGTAVLTTGGILYGAGIMKAADTGLAKAAQTVERAQGIGQAFSVNISSLKRWILNGFDAKAAQLQPGDVFSDYSWLQPIGIGLSMGAAVAEYANQHKSEAQGNVIDKLLNAGDTFFEALGAGTTSITEEPLFQGVGNLFKGGVKQLVPNVITAFLNMPSSFVPTFLNQVRTKIDNVSRNTKDPSLIKQELVNQILNKVPGLSQTLPPNVDIFGKDKEKYRDASNTIFNTFLNPSFVTKFQPSPEAKMVIDLYNSTGETSQVPRSISNRQKVNGQDRILTTNEVAKMQKLVGTFSVDRLSLLAKNPAYNALNDEKKAQVLGNIMSDIVTAAKVVLLGHVVKKPTDRQRLYVRLMRQGY